MKNEKDKIEMLLASFQGQWDVLEPQRGHEHRFAERLDSNEKPVRKLWLPISVAASIVLLLGVAFFVNQNQAGKNEMQFASAQTRETDSVFNSMLRLELNKLKSQKSPENQKIIDDACAQLKIMEADYEKIRLDLAEKGESRQIIYALILNLQTRISFLQNVLLQIENTNKLKTLENEKTM